MGLFLAIFVISTEQSERRNPLITPMTLRDASMLVGMTIWVGFTQIHFYFCGSIRPVQRQFISAVLVVASTTQAGLQPALVAFKLASNHQVLVISL